MINTEYTVSATEKAEKNFENIRESIKGLYEILSLVFAEDEDNIYFHLGEDNLVGLYQNIAELLTNDYGLRQLVKKLSKSKLELNLTLDELAVEEF